MSNVNIEKGFTIPVLDYGYVRYVDHLGSDQRICEAARISYLSASKGDEKDKKLLFYLYKSSHSSPFEQCNITFNIKLPLFVQGQMVRHRMQRLNQVSARYTEMKDEFYNPFKWRIQDTKNKQGSLNTEELDDQWLSKKVEAFCDDSYQQYKSLLDAGVAREMARMVLPQNLYTEIYSNWDLNNLMKFFKLRMDSHAQWEIQQYANGMFEIFEKIYPWCAEAYKTYTWELKERPQ